MGYCCRIFTPVQPVYPAASLRDFLSGAYNGPVGAVSALKMSCAGLTKGLIAIGAAMVSRHAQDLQRRSAQNWSAASPNCLRSFARG
jgi:hypothetical protein